MAWAFHENLQVLKKSFSVMCNMSQMMIAHYWEKTRDRDGSQSRSSTLPTRPACTALCTLRSQGLQSTSTTGPSGDCNIASTSTILNIHPNVGPPPCGNRGQSDCQTTSSLVGGVLEAESQFLLGADTDAQSRLDMSGFLPLAFSTKRWAARIQTSSRVQMLLQVVPRRS